MKQYLLFFIILVFWSFTNENVTILNSTKFGIKDIKDYIEIISKDSEASEIYQYYGFDPESCKLRKKESENNTKICYVSLFFNYSWYYFCSEINITECKDEGANFTECCKIYCDINDYFVKNDTYKYNKLQIDCDANNIRYLNILPLIILIFFI